MALSKNITLESGVNTAYHKISHICVSKVDKEFKIVILVDSYVNEVYRQKNTPVHQKQFNAIINDSTALNDNIFNLAYEYLKTTDYFKYSYDV